MAASQSPLLGLLIDDGGPIYDDDNFFHAARRALNLLLSEKGIEPPSEREVRRAYDVARNTDGMSIRRHLAAEFLGNHGSVDAFKELTGTLWRHHPETLYQDALAFMKAVYPFVKIAIVANQESATRDALKRDGVGEYVDVWGISADVGFEKPAPGFFQWALDALGCDASEALHIGNRFDNDVSPAKQMGLRAAWLLRGESPDLPQPSQLDQADWVLEDLSDFAHVVIALSGGQAFR